MFHTTTVRLDGPATYTPMSAAEVLGMDEIAVREFIDAGLLPVVKAGNREFITASALVDLMSQLDNNALESA
jgi:hypothetical protein